ncbi:MAG: alpha/beta hydrolase [Steroidobacteraceae bacterium]
MPARSSDLYLETGGVRLRYRDEGRGCAVILVHGWTLDLDQWELQAAALAGESRVIRLDRRGFGLSSGLPSIAADAADLSALYRHLGFECAALVGMSQGARAVLQFAKSQPRMVSCLVLDGPPQLGAADEAVGSSHDFPDEHYRELTRTQGLAAFRREWSEHALVRLRTDDPEAHALLARMIARYPGRDLTDTAGPADAVPLAQGFESVNRPALVINGKFDLDSRKRFAEQLALQLPQVERIEIPDAGHLCNLDNPRAYNEALKGFLKRHEFSSTGH